MKKRTTLKQLARELDVSISTVSKALKNSPEISQDTIDRVKAFAKLLNYRPNNIALSLKNKKTKTIGIIIPDIVHHFFTKVIKGVEKYANSNGYNVIVGLSNESFSNEVINMEMLANGSIDGFIISMSRETMQRQDYQHYTETLNEDIPLVMFDRVVAEIPCDKVIVDDTKSAEIAVNTLINKGATKIAILTTKDYVSVGRLRTKGYLEALKNHGINPIRDLIIKIDDELLYEEDHLDVLEKQVRELLLNHTDVNGIFAVNELYAVVAMKVAKEMGYEIPNDLQVIGFTDGMLSKHATPTLSTISQHGESMGSKAAELLIQRIDERVNDLPKEPTKTVVISTNLIQRGSTK
ncbi:MAG: LacI family DNA-binding transcriptional regulator [Bacteroidetes bacterium]|nr:LacI family DNA-binding transcriptional regulator [Bacteroidota bacterium]MDA0860016.1 LacI family DNA-binding transcriptional regulator [Bacteroidota bacterium]MDA1318113.1 LacI family DNA-binding transcriptional regulator [Bacteroidota bacterium]